MLVGQREPTGTVVGQVAAGRLGARPLAHVPLGCPGATSQFRRGQRSGACHRAIEPELVADDHHRTAEQRSDIADCLLDELGHFRFVHCHIPFTVVRTCWVGGDLGFPLIAPTVR